ncbi:E3 ubiquitin-protein ligase synoviolin-like [Corapipo altera]|uniref:E3 ubiquitin-protein ligase synoviolin-like n=1 Tax=Corapipo altera TaxID=415028 RepID=UPI000FD65691|nr:E3 ubiquitin-protein ligase synoviolin-like [Corapipo altera]
MPVPPAGFAGLTEDELRAMEGHERQHLEARLQCLSNIHTLLDAALLQINQYLTVLATIGTPRGAAPAPPPTRDPPSEEPPGPPGPPPGRAPAGQEEEEEEEAEGSEGSEGPDAAELRRRRLRKLGTTPGNGTPGNGTPGTPPH